MLNKNHPEFRIDDEVLIRIPLDRVCKMPIATIAKDIDYSEETVTTAVMRLRDRGYRLNTYPCKTGLQVSHSVVTWDIAQLNGEDYYRRVYEGQTCDD